MPRTVRSIDAFYEATGEFAVGRPLAENIHRTSTAIIGRYVGPIAINSIRGVNLPLKSPTFNPHKVRLSAAPHAALLTRRVIEAPNGVAGGRTICKMDGNQVVSSLTTTRVTESPYSMNTAVTITSNVHELGHSFGLLHCAGKAACVMECTLDSPAIAEKLLSSGNPFCEQHQEDLEIAGFAELALAL